MPSDLPPGVPPNVVVFGPHANCTLSLCPVQMSVYGYRPSLISNITFITLYTLSAAIHIYLGIKWKTWFFMYCMVLGAFNAVLGYAGRVVMYYNPFNFVAFMLQIICVTSGPVYYCASIYVTLALAIKHFSPELSRFKPNLFYWIFIPCDVVCLILQAAGGALSTASAGSSQLGVHLALVGLSLQVVFMCAFCCFFVDYVIRYFRSSLHSSGTAMSTIFGLRLKLFFGFMVTAVLLILARCAYRLVELHEGYKGSLIKNETLFIALEGVFVLVAVYCLMVAHPGLVFRQDQKAEAWTQNRDGMELRSAE